MSKDISCYIKSINNTDALLKQIIYLANNNGGKWSLIYMPDHGLKMISKDTNNATLVHSDLTLEDYNVPFFMTAYDSESHIVNSNYYSGMNFLSLFSSWTGISTSDINHEQCNQLNTACKFNELKTFNIDEEVININSLAHDVFVGK